MKQKIPEKIYRCVRSVFPDVTHYCENKPTNTGFTDWVMRGEYVLEGSERKAVVRRMLKWVLNNQEFTMDGFVIPAATILAELKKIKEGK